MNLFKALGFSVSNIEAWGGHITWNASSPSLKDMRNGKIDLMIQGGFHPDARIVDLSKTRKLVWLPSDREALKKVASGLNMSVVDLAAQTYPFLSRDTATLRAAFTMGVGAHVPDEVVYKLVKAVAEKVDRVRAIHRAFKTFSLEKMAQRPSGLAYHPGAGKYYREKGVAN
jgi:TRAP transporter TAXI family solute receptor